MSLYWSLLFINARLFHKSSSVLDHSPLLLHFSKGQDQGKHKKGFRFKSIWLKDPRCEGIVSVAWTKFLVDTSPHLILSCLNLCRTKLEACNQSEFGYMGREIARL